MKHKILDYVFLGLVFAAAVGAVYYLEYAREHKTNPKTGSVSDCLPSNRKLTELVSFGVTIGQTLKSLEAKCQNDILVDPSGKEIIFYNLVGCWGNPPMDYRELLKKQDDEINNLKKKYIVVAMDCYTGDNPQRDIY